ncbi:Uncharacterized membrane protein YagU, involved in acid resistance, DUF1440 family [Chitinophaga costaii]|uniref:Uncharacterized membrane protein YagU, involved in acid resistance, DUF1440 family n=1 Tax=Chitinophaga costaii TaxID=1335309 RepID=A0A1C3Z392_9BACT|nr:DUF1440 domain-containing protein [Chitinophaga costaii]PUZ30210.1 DUF1440 domain-containing protein [Chitinophaga costaii]SCB76728.1 Uncharacterized membrane protein YagU, involved in acid resistance, DUF1440 family [Chitinophaga costaii]
MNNLTKDIIKGVAAGLFASWIKSIAEPPLQRVGEKYFPPKAGQLSLKGADVLHQPENMPPSILAKKVYHATTGKELSKQQALTSMKVIHYALGTVIGLTYVRLVNRHEKLKIEAGLTAGAAVWAATHGSVVPALGLQGKVKEMPSAWWVWEFGSHLVFGVAMEQSRQLLNKIF